MATDKGSDLKQGNNVDPVSADLDLDELSGNGSAGTMTEELKKAQTAGSRNDRVTEYEGVERHVEPTTRSEYPGGLMSDGAKDGAAGISNRTLGAERAGQDAVMGERREDGTDAAGGGMPYGGKPIEGGLPSKKEERVETVEVSTMTPKE